MRKNEARSFSYNIFILLGHHYEPTSACPSETEEASLSDGVEEDEVEDKDGRLYQNTIPNHPSRHGTVDIQGLATETSMKNSNHVEVSQLSDAEEEEGQVEQIINAASLTNNKSTSITRNSTELQKENPTYKDDKNNGTEINVELQSQTDNFKEHCHCCTHNSGPSEILPPTYCRCGSQEELVLSTCHCSQTSTEDKILQIHDETKTERSLGDSNLLNEELPSLISCTSTTKYPNAGESLNDTHLPTEKGNEEQSQTDFRISPQIDPSIMAVSADKSDVQLHSEGGLKESKRSCNITQTSLKVSPLPSTSASANIGSPPLPHCRCHSHVQHHHHHHVHHHIPIHQPLSQSDLALSTKNDDKDATEEVMDDGLPIHKTPHKSSGSAEHNHSNSEVSCRSPVQKIQGTTQETMTADNVDEIVQDHDNFGTDENEDSLDSVATHSLNETITSQEEEDTTIEASFQFSLKIKQKTDTMTPNISEIGDSVEENNLDISGALSGTKRKPDECTEDVSGPSHVKKKRTTAISRSNSTVNVGASSLLKRTPTSAPRTSHAMPASIITRGVSDVNMASTAFHLDDEQDPEDEDSRCRQNEILASKQVENEVRSVGRQRCWSAGTLHTEEEICSVANNATINFSSGLAQNKSDSLDIVPGLSTCETVTLASPCPISTAKNVFADAHVICCSSYTCKHPIKSCSRESSIEQMCLSEHEEKLSATNSCFENSTPYKPHETTLDGAASFSSNKEIQLCDEPENEGCNLKPPFTTSLISNDASKELTADISLHSPHSIQQLQLMKLIPDKNYPPDDILNWKDSFTRWSNAKRLLALDQLIGICEPQQVRHMMAVIEPQFQRDFISLLPKEVVNYKFSNSI